MIQTERKFFQLCRRIDQIAEELEEFKFALFDDKECGLSVKELYLTSDLDEPSLNIKQEYQYFTFSEVPNFLRRMKVYSKYASWMEEPAYLWRDRKSFANLNVSDQKEIENTIREVPRYQQRISAEVEKLIGVGLNLEDCASLFLKEDDMLGMISVLKDDDTYRYFRAMVNSRVSVGS